MCTNVGSMSCFSMKSATSAREICALIGGRRSQPVPVHAGVRTVRQPRRTHADPVEVAVADQRVLVLFVAKRVAVERAQAVRDHASEPPSCARASPVPTPETLINRRTPNFCIAGTMVAVAMVHI